MATTTPTTQNAPAAAGQKEFKPTQAQLALIGALAYGGFNKLVGTSNGIVKLQLHYYNTKDKKNIVVGVNSNGNVSAYGTLHLTVYLQSKTYSVRYEYLGKEFEKVPDWVNALLPEYKLVDATAHTLQTLQEQIAALQAKAAKLPK
jgi:hypothetical protein